MTHDADSLARFALKEIDRAVYHRCVSGSLAEQECSSYAACVAVEMIPRALTLEKPEAYLVTVIRYAVISSLRQQKAKRIQRSNLPLNLVADFGPSPMVIAMFREEMQPISRPTSYHMQPEEIETLRKIIADHPHENDPAIAIRMNRKTGRKLNGVNTGKIRARLGL